MCVLELVLARACGAAAPVHDFGFIDFEPCVVCCCEARGSSGGAVHVDNNAASSTNEVMVIVSDAVLVQGRGANRLDAPNEALLCEHSERVVHRLARDRPDFVPGNFYNAISRDVRANRHCSKNGEALSCDLESV
jgi:hypothetical protein